MGKLDDLILDQLVNTICKPERLLQLMSELRKRTRDTKDDQQHKLDELMRQMTKVEKAQRNLFSAIENGLPYDELLQKRAQELKSDRESLLIEMAGVGRAQSVPADRILPSNIEAFSKADSDQASEQGIRQALSASTGR